jgi:hypothetical protein
MFPAIMAVISMLRQKAQNENQDLQNLQQNMQTPVQTELPSINSVFGNR